MEFRNIAVVHDKNNRESRRVQHETGFEKCNTFADEFQSVLSMVQTDSDIDDPFVR